MYQSFIILGTKSSIGRTIQTQGRPKRHWDQSCGNGSGSNIITGRKDQRSTYNVEVSEFNGK